MSTEFPASRIYKRISFLLSLLGVIVSAAIAAKDLRRSRFSKRLVRAS